jgi:hypothetical protein
MHLQITNIKMNKREKNILNRKIKIIFLNFTSLILIFLYLDVILISKRRLDKIIK